MSTFTDLVIDITDALIDGLPKGGATVDITTGKAVSPNGFAVSLNYYGSAIDARTAADRVALTDVVGQWVSDTIGSVDALQSLYRAPLYMGAWRCREGRVYVDVTVVIGNRTNALTFAASQDQEAVFDFGAGEEIYLHDDDGEPLTDLAARSLWHAQINTFAATFDWVQA